MRSASPPGSPRAVDRAGRGTGPQTQLGAPVGDASQAEPDESWLEQLVGVHSTKTGYYAQWRGTKQDLERALDALRALSEALCVTSLGPVTLCDGVLEALGTLFDAEWTALVLVGQDIPSTIGSYFAWCQNPAGGRAPSPQQASVLADHVTSEPKVLSTTLGREDVDADGDQAVPVHTITLGVPLKLDYRHVGSLLVGIRHTSGQDRIGMSILETVANQIVIALRNAWLYEKSEDLRQRAADGWAEAERRADELTRRNQQLRRAGIRLARVRQVLFVSAERHRIARDLHDGVAQCLVGIGMHLEWCHRQVDSASPAYGRLVASKELARAALARIRTAVAELSELERPGNGLAQALHDLAADFRSGGLLGVSVRVVGLQRPLPPEAEHSLFQIAQEGLWNVVRHAGAGAAWVQLRYTASEIILSVADDGHGDPAVISRYLDGAGRPRGRYGLRNVAERAAELGGTVTAERRRGGGLRIRVRIPRPGTSSEPDGDLGSCRTGLVPP